MLNTYIVKSKYLRNAPKASVISPNGVGIKPLVVRANLFIMENQEEIWKSVVGYIGFYEVSNFGRVKSLPRPNNGFGTRIKSRIMKPDLGKRGYYRVGLYTNGLSKKYMVHRLVAIAFIDNPENKPEVNHINGIKHDNRIENLENTHHAWNNNLVVGQCHLGEKNNRTNLKNSDVVAIFEYCKTHTAKEAAIRFNIRRCVAYGIKSKSNWSHLTKNL